MTDDDTKKLCKSVNTWRYYGNYLFDIMVWVLHLCIFWNNLSTFSFVGQSIRKLWEIWPAAFFFLAENGSTKIIKNGLKNQQTSPNTGVITLISCSACWWIIHLFRCHFTLLPRPQEQFFTKLDELIEKKNEAAAPHILGYSQRLME